MSGKEQDYFEKLKKLIDFGVPTQWAGKLLEHCQGNLEQGFPFFFVIWKNKFKFGF